MCGRLRVGKDFLHVRRLGSVQPCVRPVGAVHPSADQVPVKNPHSTMRWHWWVVLIAGSTGSALRAVRPPNLHITPVVRHDPVYAASATGSLYRSPLAIMAQTIRAILLASAMQHQTALLLGGLGWYEPHVRPGDRLANAFCVSRIVLLPLDVGLHIGRRHQPHGVTQCLELARPIVR